MNNTDKIKAALSLAYQYGQIDGAHHKTWVIDQMVRVLAGEGYAAFIADYELDATTGDEYEWDVGINP